MIYERVLRPLLFALDPEIAHHFTLSLLRSIGLVLPKTAIARTPISAFGLNFSHRVGLAAGLDKNGLALPAWEALGFAFVEIGTVTTRAQPGNPRPRIFRYPKQQALINRLGFNNDGADAIAERLAKLREHGHWPRIPVGINIGKSRATPLERAGEEYVYSLRKLHDKTKLPIIGCGGISDAESAREKIEAGAKLLQIYTGFVYRGPSLIRELATL